MNDSSPGIERAPNRQRDGRTAFTVVLVCLVLVGSLVLISRNAPSSIQQESVALVTDAVSAAEGCTNFASFWTDPDGAAVPIDAVMQLTNCRMDDDGDWFVPAGANDPRLPEAQQLSSTEAADVAALEETLLADLDELQNILPRSLTEALKANFESTNMPVFGHTRKGRTDLSAKRARYVRVTQAFLLQPSRAVLADYVGWVMERRSTAVGTFVGSCHADPDRQFLQRACDGLWNEFGIGVIPLYWDLEDPVLIQDYLIARVRSGEPLPIAVPDALPA